MKDIDSVRGNVGRLKKHYERPDPDSVDAFYEKEGKPDVEVTSSLPLHGATYEFSWRRSKSDENVDSRGFSFYFARWAYVNDYRVVNGQKVGKTTAYVKTDDGNEGLLATVRLSMFEGYDEEDDYFDDVLLVVRQETVDDGRVRLVSCYPTKKKEYVDFYTVAFLNRARRPLKLPDYVDFKDLRDGAKKMMEKKEHKEAARAFEEALKERKKEYETSLERNYDVFVGLVRVKTPLKSTY